MSKMFQNYDNNIDCDLSSLEPKSFPRPIPLQSAPNISLLYDLKGRMYGVEVKHHMPFSLYFHLDEMQGQSLVDFVEQSIVEFKLIGQNHKIILVKTFNGSEIFTMGSDLVIDLNQEDIEELKQETYKMELTLLHDTDSYKLFAESDALLVVR